MTLPADPLNPEMNARRSSQWARYSLESGNLESQRSRPSVIGLLRTLILAGDDNSVHIVLCLSHELPKSAEPLCGVDRLCLCRAHREWSEALDGWMLGSDSVEEGKRERSESAPPHHLYEDD